MTVKEAIRHKRDISEKPKYEYLPPEGGWGYIVTLSTSLFLIVTVVPMAAFGIVYGVFLSQIGDETGGTTLVNGIFNTVMNFTGLAVNQMLKTMTCRKVGLMGAFMFFLGSFANIFVTSVTQLVLSFGVMQGIGFGLMLPSCFTSFNSYFDKKKNVMMGIAQALVVAVTIAWPALSKMLMENYGFRGTLAIFSGLSLHGFVAMLTLQPVEWHMIKRKLSSQEYISGSITLLGAEKQDIHETKTHTEVELEEKLLYDETIVEEPRERKGSYVVKKPRPSIISIGSIAASVGSNLHKLHKKEEKSLSKWQRFSKVMDLELFKDPVYVNITIGLSLALTSDLAFMSLLPLLLLNLNFTATEVTQIMTIYFLFDLLARILISILSAIRPIRNRYIVLVGALLSSTFRIAFVVNSSFTWIASVAAVLGFLRCLIQTPLPLVIAEEYSTRFATAFSLYMVVCGVISLISGPLIGFVKKVTQSDTMVVHALTVIYLLCAIPWAIELFASKLCRSAKKT